MCKCCSPGALYCTAALTLIIALGFLFVTLFVPSIIDNVLTQGLIAQRIVTSNTSKGYDQWVTSDVCSWATLLTACSSRVHLHSILRSSCSTAQTTMTYCTTTQSPRFKLLNPMFIGITGANLMLNFLRTVGRFVD